MFKKFINITNPNPLFTQFTQSSYISQTKHFHVIFTYKNQNHARDSSSTTLPISITNLPKSRKTLENSWKKRRVELGRKRWKTLPLVDPPSSPTFNLPWLLLLLPSFFLFFFLSAPFSLSLSFSFFLFPFFLSYLSIPPLPLYIYN